MSWFRKIIARLFGSNTKTPPQPRQESNAWRFETAGARNNNPLNVKGSGWQGQTAQDSRGHAIFLNRAWGLRAAAITLRTYWAKHHRRSIAAILARWAPVTDTVGSLPGAPRNSPREYSEFIQRQTGLDPLHQLQLFGAGGEVYDERQLFAVMDAMSAFENGRVDGDFYRISRDEFNKAMKLI